MGENMEGNTTIIPGDKLEIRVLQEMVQHKEGAELPKVYLSSVTDILSETEYEVMMPIREGKMYLLPVDVRFDFLFMSNGGLSHAIGIVRERYKKDNLFVLKAELVTNITKVQRREFYRMSCTLDFKFMEIEPEIANLPSTEQILLHVAQNDMFYSSFSGTILDISGGGIRFVSDIVIDEKQHILCELQLDNEAVTKKIQMVGQILASRKLENADGIREYRVKFLVKDTKVREELIHYIFEEERKIRRKAKG